MKVKTKIIDVNINTPKLSYAKEGDAGIDLTATSKWYDENGNVCFGTNRDFEESEELSETERGNGGYGSTGN